MPPCRTSTVQQERSPLVDDDDDAQPLIVMLDLAELYSGRWCTTEAIVVREQVLIKWLSLAACAWTTPLQLHAICESIIAVPHQDLVHPCVQVDRIAALILSAVQVDDSFPSR